MPANWDKIKDLELEKGARFEVTVRETWPTILPPFPILEKEPKLPNGLTPDFMVGVSDAGVAYVEVKDHTSGPFNSRERGFMQTLEAQKVWRPFHYLVEVWDEVKENPPPEFAEQCLNWMPGLDELGDSKTLYTQQRTRIDIMAIPSPTGIGGVIFGTVKGGNTKKRERRVEKWLRQPVKKYSADALNGAPLILAININPEDESFVLDQLNGQGVGDLVRRTFYRRIEGQTLWWRWDEAGRLEPRNRHLAAVLVYVEGKFKRGVMPETPGLETPLAKKC